MSKVIIEKNGPVKTVWMNRPEKKNALDSELLSNMIDALQAPVAADDRVIVIRGKGTVFCAGLDMAERSKTAGAGKASGIEIMLRAIELCPLPVVAVVHGDAIAGGNELALHCDIVVASQTARFGMSLAPSPNGRDGVVIAEVDGAPEAADAEQLAAPGRSAGTARQPARSPEGRAQGAAQHQDQ